VDTWHTIDIRKKDLKETEWENKEELFWIRVETNEKLM
jgi:hypothetical protein